MKPRPLTRVLSTTVALLTALAWFLAANHCAMAGLMPKPAAAPAGHEHCPAPEDSSSNKGQSGDCDGLNCCKSLSAPAAFAKKLVGYDKAFPILKDYVVGQFAFPSDQSEALIAELDTGPPPPATSFAESILQRSLLAHAPPSLS